MAVLRAAQSPLRAAVVLCHLLCPSCSSAQHGLTADVLGTEGGMVEPGLSSGGAVPSLLPQLFLTEGGMVRATAGGRREPPLPNEIPGTKGLTDGISHPG